MYCEICHSFSPRYCSCASLNHDRGEVIHGSKRGEEMKVKLEKFTHYMEDLQNRFPDDQSLVELKEFFGLEHSAKEREAQKATAEAVED